MSTPPANGLPPKPPCAAQSGMAVAVVSGALVGVAQHLVGLAGLLELLFRRVVARVAVRMVLERLLAIGALQLLVAHLASTRREPRSNLLCSLLY